MRLSIRKRAPMRRAAIITTMMTMTTLTDSGLYRLLAWLSPSFPVGAFSYSHGIEAAVEAGRVVGWAGLENWGGAILRHGTGPLGAGLFSDAGRGVAPYQTFIAAPGPVSTPTA